MQEPKRNFSHLSGMTIFHGYNNNTADGKRVSFEVET
jgi:hypothetical protein